MAPGKDSEIAEVETHVAAADNDGKWLIAVFRVDADDTLHWNIKANEFPRGRIRESLEKFEKDMSEAAGSI